MVFYSAVLLLEENKKNFGFCFLDCPRVFMTVKELASCGHLQIKSIAPDMCMNLPGDHLYKS